MILMNAFCIRSIQRHDAVFLYFLDFKVNLVSGSRHVCIAAIVVWLCCIDISWYSGYVTIAFYTKINGVWKHSSIDRHNLINYTAH